MTLDWNRVLPVIISIISIAILRQYSRFFAAIVATMPVNITLGMWLISSSAEDSKADLEEFNRALLINIIPTLIFILVAWQAARAGWNLMTILLAGYIVWVIGIGVILLPQNHFSA
jgi:hypothetical protein